MSLEPHLLIRSAAVYLAAVLVAIAWGVRRPNRRELAAGVLSVAWLMPSLLLVHLAAIRLGWWRFDAEGGLLLGIPVDLWLSWLCLWGPVPTWLFPRAPIVPLTLGAGAADLLVMPFAAPVVGLGHFWLVGEALLLAVAFVPAQLLARWTMRDSRLEARATLQMVAFGGLIGFIIPTIAVAASNGQWSADAISSGRVLVISLQLLALLLLPGTTALQEFVTRGHGTPVPFDPPKHLVSSGVYSYLRNPMQLSGVASLVALGIVLGNVWVSAAGLLAHVYSIGIAGWDEDADLAARFGDRWIVYRRSVPRWVPRWRPWFADGRPAHLFVAGDCDACSQVGRWFSRQGATHLSIVAASTHPSGALTRITYESPDRAFTASGIHAIGRALEHVHLGWALLSFAIRVPVVAPVLQLMVDAAGGGARTTAVSTARERPSA